MGIPDYLTCLLSNLYTGQEATVRTRHGKVNWFQIGKWVHQACILSPCLFDVYAEYTMQNARLDEAQAGFKIAGRNINNLRYVDDTTFMAESEEELKSLLMRVKEGSEKVGLKLKDWRQEKWTTEDEMLGWLHQLNAHEFEQVLGVGEGQVSLVCCSPRGCRVRHYWVTEPQQILCVESSLLWHSWQSQKAIFLPQNEYINFYKLTVKLFCNHVNNTSWFCRYIQRCFNFILSKIDIYVLLSKFQDLLNFVMVPVFHQ